MCWWGCIIVDVTNTVGGPNAWVQVELLLAPMMVTFPKCHLSVYNIFHNFKFSPNSGPFWEQEFILRSQSFHPPRVLTAWTLLSTWHETWSIDLLSKWTSTKSLKCGSYKLVQFFGEMRVGGGLWGWRVRGGERDLQPKSEIEKNQKC